MATASFRSIIEQIKKLSPDEQRELRAVLDTLLPSAAAVTEEEFEHEMVAAGLLIVPSPEAHARAARKSFKPVTVRGRPVSETLIEERR
jgi:hypothetical protein